MPLRPCDNISNATKKERVVEISHCDGEGTKLLYELVVSDVG
ncbi:hypothetical protein BRCON_1812 [Candidatus Sumerlaea chitinivorans]|uniref:Uncharacterized protein n=1 Tax=Sumerlaea chitinivorans TaxID=2250252 RepID=A0A2Z4Y6N0_SUMC1|nr:hypothetical protein BRCON_1812 [Candidatus Sumerlaea chitinivorans]